MSPNSCPDLEEYVKEVDESKQLLILVNKADFLTEPFRFVDLVVCLAGSFALTRACVTARCPGKHGRTISTPSVYPTCFSQLSRSRSGLMPLSGT